MNILHLGKFYPPYHGGMEYYLRDLAEQQAKYNQVTVVVHNHQFKKFTSTSINETINKVNVYRQKTLRPILFTPIMFGLNKLINKKLKNKACDVIHISWPNPSALFLLLNKKAKKTPWVIQWQSDMVTDNSSWLLKLAYKFFKPFEKKLLNQASAIIASTEEYLKHSTALQNHKEKCHIIPLGVKELIITMEQQDLDWANNLWEQANTKIFNIGRLTFYKNHQLLINAAIQLPDTTFIITGSGQLESKLKQLIKEKSIDNVLLTGSISRSKINALFQTCDAFCLPSNDRAESYGMVLLEALQFNKPILVSNLPGSGMKWIASQTSLGYTFNSNDPSDLVIKINNLKDHSKQTQLDLSQFSIEHCQQKIDSIYQSILDQR